MPRRVLVVVPQTNPCSGMPMPTSQAERETQEFLGSGDSTLVSRGPPAGVRHGRQGCQRLSCKQMQVVAQRPPCSEPHVATRKDGGNIAGSNARGKKIPAPPAAEAGPVTECMVVVSHQIEAGARASSDLQSSLRVERAKVVGRVGPWLSAGKGLSRLWGGVQVKLFAANLACCRGAISFAHEGSTSSMPLLAKRSRPGTA